MMKTELIMTPKQRYLFDLKTEGIFPDSDQAKAVQQLELVYEGLLKRWQKPEGILQSFMKKMLGRSDPVIVQGLYFWGGVGRGKTYLMDLFYQCLPGERKMRMHFHRFMQLVHRGLNENKGQKNPLNRVAENIASEVDVICFDEFFVSDIGDAMILGNLLEVLLNRGITFIATSNIAPDFLYENGLQRERFLPAIKLIKSHTKTVNLAGSIDYRLRRLEKAEIFHTPLNAVAESAMSACFIDLSTGLETKENWPLDILGRDILAKYCSEGLVWFEFSELCSGPRSAADYIEIAQLFHTVILTNIPIFNERSEDEARRFISLIDEFYDHKVKLVFSAESQLETLYQGSELHFPYERTLSRLLEMQSHDYLALEHSP